MATVTGKTKIFRKDFNGKPVYSRGISSQKFENGQKGDWITVYENVQLPKDTILEDKTVIEFNGFEAVYEAKDGTAKRKLVITDFRVSGDDMAKPANAISAKAAEGFSALQNDDIPF